MKTDWIAPAGIRAVEPGPEFTAIPDAALSDPRLSLTAKGIYGLLLSYQGNPMDPYLDAFEDPEEIRRAVQELIAADLIVRLER